LRRRGEAAKRHDLSQRLDLVEVEIAHVKVLLLVTIKSIDFSYDRNVGTLGACLLSGFASAPPSGSL
jgi:hypothetical protein